MIDIAFYYILKEIILFYTKDEGLLYMQNFTIFLKRFGSDIRGFAILI